MLIVTRIMVACTNMIMMDVTKNMVELKILIFFLGSERPTKETDTAPFNCSGTSKRRHDEINHVNLRDKHLVDASIANPVQFKKKRSYIKGIDKKRYKIEWIKCMDCLASDSLFEREVSTQSPYKQSQKRNREEKKIKAKKLSR
jgi:hypothetical protein